MNTELTFSIAQGLGTDAVNFLMLYPEGCTFADLINEVTQKNHPHLYKLIHVIRNSQQQINQSAPISSIQQVLPGPTSVQPLKSTWKRSRDKWIQIFNQLSVTYMHTFGDLALKGAHYNNHERLFDALVAAGKTEQEIENLFVRAECPGYLNCW